MTGPIKAIETRYAGCRFRSRLEARWAVFMDALDISWDFEAQGFHTPAGGYLPDFYLVDHDLYVEIKGPPPGEQELAKCQHIPNLIILVGSVPRRPEDITYLDFGECTRGGFHLLHACNDGWRPWSGRPPFLEGCAKDDVQAALTEARSARFEHGETGRRSGS